jgi:hypothetical protein
MALQTLEPEENTSALNVISSSEIFAAVQQLSSQMDEIRISQVVNAVNCLTTKDNQMMVDLLSMVHFFRSPHW